MLILYINVNLYVISYVILILYIDCIIYKLNSYAVLHTN